ncbi:MAG: rRNA pseudouridine synthase [Chitinivibrionales bacterium]|nr:rRNA pseudouridine synthase [Chitinivibrionales bacterium]
MQEKKTQHIRLNRYLSLCGVGSRRQCDDFIATGRVMVNGTIVTTLGMTIDPQKDTVRYRDTLVAAPQAYEYVAFNKPPGLIVTKHDTHGRQTVFEFLKKKGVDVEHLKYVGRLDEDSEGLLLLTNDGEFLYQLTHPRFGIKKIYQVLIDKPLSPAHRHRIVTEGIVHTGERLSAESVRSIQYGRQQQHKEQQQKECVWYQVVLHEGKKRHIRRMFLVLGYTVHQLIRIQFGSIMLGHLHKGEYRILSSSEVAALRTLVKAGR